MSFTNYGFDPSMAADADQIFQSVIDIIHSQGQIDANTRNMVMSQYGTYRNSIISGVMSKAAQAGRSADRQMIQDAIHSFVANVLQSPPRAGSYGGYGSVYGQSQYGGYGQVYGGGYPPPQPTGTFYPNPNWQTSQPAYGQSSYGGYPSGQMTGGYTPGVYGTPSASVTASRFSSGSQTPTVPNQAPTSRPISTPADAYAINNTKIEYTAPMEISRETINNSMFSGTKRVIRISSENMCDVFNVTLAKPVIDFKDFFKTFSANITSKNQFIMANVQTYKLIKAKAVEVSALLQKFAAILNKSIAESGGDLELTHKHFSKFYTEFVKESGAAHKALSNFLVDEFNATVACGYLFGPGIKHKLVIDSLDDIFELYDENTKDKCIREWRQCPNYKLHLSAVIKRAIFSIFLGRNKYQMVNVSDNSNNGIISSVFKDLSADGISVKDSFSVLTKAIMAKSIDGATASAVPALNAAISENTIFLVPRTYIYTTLVPAGFIIGDYANLEIDHVISQVSSTLEDCIVAGYKALVSDNTTPVIRGIICSGAAMYGFRCGANADKHVYIAPITDPIITM